MRALVLLLALSGCGTVPVAELGQSFEERASGVVYAVVEPGAPQVSALRPMARPVAVTEPVAVAQQYVGYTEAGNRAELRAFLGVDPRQTEWCAAFVNAVLNHTGQAGSESISENPLLARSFLLWGEPVDHRKETPKPGDVVVFPRGRQSWQGHVGFYVDTVSVDGKVYWQILGGNQKNSVSVELYPASRAIGVRRAPVQVVQESKGLFHWINRLFVA